MSFEPSSKKLKFDISRSSVTLTFDPRSLKLFKVEDFVINYVFAKFGDIWTRQSKVKKYSILGQKSIFLKLQYFKDHCINLYQTSDCTGPE